MGKRIYTVPKAASSSDTRKKRDKKKIVDKSSLHFDVYENDTNPADDDGEKTDNYELESLVIDAEDDEEISEDEAFNDEDEERWGDFFSKGSNGKVCAEIPPTALIYAKQNVPQQIADDLVEDFQGVDDENEEGDVDLSQLLSDDGEEHATNDGLKDLIFSLDDQNAANTNRTRKRSQLESVSESSTNIASGLSLAALMDVDARESQLNKRLRKLDDAGGNIKSVTAPLPVRTQQMLDRQAAYESSSKDVSKWMPIVQKNRQADQLVFPMNVAPRQNATNASLTGKFQVRGENSGKRCLNHAGSQRPGKRN